MIAVEAFEKYRDRFTSKVATGDASECWNWTGAKNAHGYGHIRDGAKTILAHRISAALFIGDPNDRTVCHRCDNPTCVNPAHLYIGTMADNNRDCRDRGRHGTARGAANANSKLDDAAVVDILTSDMQSTALARKYGVRHAIVCSVMNRTSWKHVAPDLPARKGRHASKLTDQQVIEIRASDESGTALSARFGISQSIVSQIRSRQIWRHL